VLIAEKVWESMRKCAKSWEVCLKYEKMCKLQFLQYKCYFFAVQMIFFWCAVQICLVCWKKIFERAVQTFAAFWQKFCFSEKKFWVCSTNFCRLMVQVLPLYSFAVFCVLCYIIFEAQYKSLLHFSRGGGIKAFLWTACCCQ